MDDKKLDFENPPVYDGIQFEGCYLQQRFADKGYTNVSHNSGPFVLKADYDNLLLAYKYLFENAVASGLNQQ